MSISQEEHLRELARGYRFDWKDPSTAVFEPKRGLSAQVVEEISDHKQEPVWMREFRLKALEHFEARPMPEWAGGHMDSIVTLDSVVHRPEVKVVTDRPDNPWPTEHR